MYIIKSDLSGCNTMSLNIQDQFCSCFAKKTMRTKLFNFPSKCLFIYWMFWFAQIRNMWGILDTSHATITDNDNLENKPYFCFVLLANLADILIPVDSRQITSGILITFIPYLSLQMSSHLDRWMIELNKLYIQFDAFQTPLEAGCLCTSEAYYFFMA